jgi:hypothetical protein
VSEVTLVKHVTYLERVLKLIKKTSVLGDNAGATYEVFLPEEIGLEGAFPTPTPPTPTPTSTTTPTSIQKVGVGDVKKVGGVGGGNLPDNSITYGDPKTFLKTKSNTNDDEASAFSELNEKLASAVRKLTGKATSKKEAERWGDLADLLILELEVAARRSSGVSSVPAFLTEVLRRQFFSARQQPVPKASKTKPDTVGKTETSSYEIKPLDAKEREAALEQLREFASDEFLQDFKKWYTEEDWKWLTESLEGK